MKSILKYNHIKTTALLFILLISISGCNPKENKSVDMKNKIDTLNTATVATDILNEIWWKERHESVLNRRNTNPQLILVGNSIFNDLDSEDRKEFREKYLNKYNTLNMGFSGDRTENVIWRLQNGEIDSINPKLAIVLIGTNNTDGNNYPSTNTSEEIAEGIWKICEIIKETTPDTKIILLGIFPYGKNIPNLRNTINQNTNDIISKFPERNNKINYLYIGDIFLNHDGSVNNELLPDFLHPSVEGDMLWFETLKPHMEKLMK